MSGKKNNISLFDDDEENGDSIKINKGYAQRYDNWRRLEEMQKIKDRYGDDYDDDSESSEEEPEWSDKHEEAFLKTLGALKSGDKSVFKEGKGFFEQIEQNSSKNKSKENTKKENSKMTIKDYERKLVLEKEGKIDEIDDDEIYKLESKPGYHEEQEELRKGLASAILEIDNEVDDDILVERKKTQKELEKDDEDFAKWLKSDEGKQDSNKAKELKHLKKFWKNDTLDESEKFLRDYLLNKDYEPGEAEKYPTYEEIVALEEDEKEFDKNNQYERKYNFRFEDPDQDFIKQYPRTIAESMRTENSSRKEKRHEREERKRKEKEEKKKELKELQKMKKSEIEQKLLKLKKAAGCDIPISIEELNAEFDPKEFDKKMQQIFNDEYYGVEENVKEDEDEKPIFSDVDSDYEDYDKMDDEALRKMREGNKSINQNEEEEEDEENEEMEEPKESKNEESKEEGKKFNMVLAAQKAMKKDKEDSRRKKKRQAFREALAKKKPQFDPNEKTFEEYFNEFHALDYEDIIGDQVTKFKYREVEPNDFGLTADEILNADERQLNAWASLKKVTAYRTKQEEQFDKKAYEKRAKDLKKKQRIFSTDFGGKKSLKRKAEEERIAKEIDNLEANNETEESSKKKKKRGKKKKTTNTEVEIEKNEVVPDNEKVVNDEKTSSFENEGNKIKRRRNKGNKKNAITEKFGKGMTDSRVKAYGLNPNRLKKGLIYRT